jgi:hypothetical protein
MNTHKEDCMKLPANRGSRSFPQLLAITGAVLLALLCATNLQAKQSTSHQLTLTPSSTDYAAAAAAKNQKIHARPAHTPAGRSTGLAAISNSPNVTAPVAPVAAPDSGGPRYPADLQFHGGNVVPSMQHHAIYMNPNGTCTIVTCWGDPEGFLRDLGESDFIHVVDQYTGGSGPYTVSSTHFTVNYHPNAAPFTDADMLAIVHAAASLTGQAGYGNEYHVFLPPGQDECFNLGYKVCYSPDDPKTFFFCAYHGSADFSDIGHVLYSVEPFQDNFGCSSRPGTPNGQLADSTNNVLSHEVFETITDPDGTAWWNSLDNGIFGEEIGDECSFLLFTATNVYFDPSNVTLNGKAYVAQPEYDNAAHACTTSP